MKILEDLQKLHTVICQVDFESNKPQNLGIQYNIGFKQKILDCNQNKENPQIQDGR